MGEPLYFEELTLGARWKSRCRTVTETDVVNFAGLTGDFDPLHMDHEFARLTPFGKPIAHGLLGLGLVAGLGSNFPAVHTVVFVGIRGWEFLKPLLIGDTVHVVNEIVELSTNGRRRGRVIWKRQLVNQQGTVVQQGTFETLVARTPTTARQSTSSTVSRPARAASSRPGKSSRKKRASAAPAA